MKNLNKEEIFELFQFVESILNENPIEYQAVCNFGIQEKNILDFLKKTNRYDDFSYLNTQHYLTNHIFTDKEIRDKIGTEIFHYSFTDFMFYFENKKDSGYGLASEFLVSDFCSEQQYDSFLNTILSFSKEVELTEELEEKYMEYLEHLTR